MQDEASDRLKEYGDVRRQQIERAKKIREKKTGGFCIAGDLTVR